MILHMICPCGFVALGNIYKNAPTLFGYPPPADYRVPNQGQSPVPSFEPGGTISQRPSREHAAQPQTLPGELRRSRGPIPQGNYSTQKSLRSTDAAPLKARASRLGGISGVFLAADILFAPGGALGVELWERQYGSE